MTHADIGAKPGIPERAAALHQLLGVFRDRKMLADDSPHRKARKLESSQKAAARRLAHAVLRHNDALEDALSRYLRQKPPLAIHLILKIIAADLLLLETGAHAAVNCGVDLSRMTSPRSAHHKLVNAIGRRLSSDRDRIVSDGRMAPNRLPGPLRREIRDQFGMNAVEGIEKAHASPAPLDLTPRDADARLELAERLDAVVLPTGTLRISQPRGQISELFGYDEGRWWVQDAAAALPALALDVDQGADVLDVCAAPGGKTMQLAAVGATVTALDKSPARLRRLEANLRRTGLGARIVAADALTWSPDSQFDAVLVDPPCTATGTIRRHPELPFIRDLNDIDDLTSLQANLLDRAAEWVRPGGRLVMSTCSLLTAEGERQAERFLNRHPGWIMESLAGSLPGVPEGWILPSGAIRTRPDNWAERGGLDGFFIARFRRAG